MCLKRDAIVCIDLDGQALQLVLLIRGVDDFSLRQRLENQIEDTIVLGIISFALE